MSKTLVGLVPVALAVVGFGAVIWFLLDRNTAIGSWLFASFLAGHGLVHIMFAIPQPKGAVANANGTEYPFDASASWLVSRHHVEVGQLRPIVLALVVVTVIGYALAALATVGLLVPASAWDALVVGSTATSMLLLVIGFSPALAIGFAIDAVLLWVTFATSWSPVTPLM